MRTFCSLLFALFIAVSLTAQTKLKLPFIGTKEFNFSGGSCCNQSITIYKNGICEVRAFEAPEFGNTVTVNYSGKYTPIMWVYEKGEKSFGYKVDGGYIYSLDKNGTIESGCKE